ncbi:Uncharacterised protein [Bordetella pertussis]|nr:Uncharacterised protein [Bordetella pertussis]
MRTRPLFRDRTRPQRSRTSRCCENEGRAMLNGRASSLMAADPWHRRSSTARRVGSDKAWKTWLSWAA